jgi:hypothetical protein
MNQHPTLERAQKRAEELGSTATTTRGIVRFLKGRNERINLRPRPESAAKWKAREANRVSDPEAKRAKHDPVFRKAFLFRLKRRNEQARRTRANSLKGVTAAAESREARNREVVEVARLRSLVYGREIRADDLPKVTAGVLVKSFDARLAKKHGAYVCMVGKDATLSATRRKSFGNHCDATPSTYNHRKGRWEGYERATHDNFVRSFAIIQSDRVLDYAFHKTEVTVTLPEGFRWDVDQYGIRVLHRNGVDDYHPDAGELLNNDYTVCERLERNAERRMLTRAMEVSAKAASEGVFVCLADSVRAGNCRAGSVAFAERHGIDPSKHYHAPELLDMANGEAGRVRLAITAAILRHRKEIERGYALLEEHKA